MKNIKSLILLCLITLLGAMQIIYAQKSITQPGVIRIKVSNHLANDIEQSLKTKTDIKNIQFSDANFNALNKTYGVVNMQRLFPYAGKFEQRHRKHGLHLWYVIKVNSKAEPFTMVEAYGENENILLAEPVYAKVNAGQKLKPKLKNSSSILGPVNDTEFSKQWHYFNNGKAYFTKQGSDIWVQNAWTIETGDSNVVVAVLDGGVDIRHKDLVDNLWTNKNEIPGNGIDDDNNGFVDDIHGYNFVTDTSEIVGDDHGSHVAGIVAATTNNEIGIAGVAGGSGLGDGARIMSCEIFEGDYQSYNIANAFVYAADNGAIIAQNSWSYTNPDIIEQAILDGIDYFIENAGFDANHQPIGPMQGGIVFFASGNEGETGNWWPSCYDKVIAVGSTDGDDKKSDFSNYGTWVDISAPGGAPGIYSTIRNNLYGYFSGTSMACPHVSGVAALLIANNINNITPEIIKSRLLESADPIDHLNPGFEAKIGDGRLNAYYALLNDASDELKPNSITNLAAKASLPISLVFEWTAPGRGENNNQTVVSYDVRISNEEITADNFNVAEIVNFRHAQPAGFTEEMEISGLKPGTKYFVAIKSIDHLGNVSEISNVANNTTTEAPSMDVKEVYLDTIHHNSKELTYLIPITNVGQKKLGYSFTIDYDYISQKNWVKAKNYNDSVDINQVSNIELTYNLTGLEDGIHNVYLKMRSNDPFRNDYKITLKVLIHGNEATLLVPDTNIDFESVYLGLSIQKSLTVQNSDNSRGFLQISTTTISNSNIKVLSSLPMFIEPGQSADIIVEYNPERVETINDSMVLHTNNNAMNNLTIQLLGKSILPPVISMDNSGITTELSKGNAFTYKLDIKNAGKDTLRTRFMVESLSLVEQTNANENIELNEVFSEDFENIGSAVGWDFKTLGFGWTFSEDLSSSNFSIPEHTKYAVINDEYYGQDNNATNDYLIMPAINLGYVDSALLVFDSYFTGRYNMKASVKISTNNGQTWDIIKSLDGAESWEEIIIDLTQYIDKEVLIAFHANDQGYFSTGWAIDNVKIKTNVNWLNVELLNGQNEISEGMTSSFNIQLETENLAHGKYKANLWVLSNDPVNPKQAIPVELTVNDDANVLLSSILLNEENLDKFDPSQFIYELAIEGDKVPVVTALAQNSNANVEIIQALLLSGTQAERTCFINVTSANKLYNKQYMILFSKIVGIYEAEHKIKVFPNPFTNQISLQLSESLHNGRFEIIDILGSVLVSNTITNVSTNISTQELKNGIYFMNIYSGDSIYKSIKLIKQ